MTAHANETLVLEEDGRYRMLDSWAVVLAGDRGFAFDADLGNEGLWVSGDVEWSGGYYFRPDDGPRAGLPIALHLVERFTHTPAPRPALGTLSGPDGKVAE